MEIDDFLARIIWAFIGQPIIKQWATTASPMIEQYEMATNHNNDNNITYYDSSRCFSYVKSGKSVIFSKFYFK